MEAPRLIAIMGPTASGKTALAEKIADAIGARLVNADAFQIYRGMDVGTSKPTAKRRYDLIDIKDPCEPFGVGEWVALAMDVLSKAWEARQDVLVVGGTGLYVRALFEQYRDLFAEPDPTLREAVRAELEASGVEAVYRRLAEVAPEEAARIDGRNPRRVSRAMERALAGGKPMQVLLPPFVKLKLAVDPPKSTLDAQIAGRLGKMFQNGWVQEVESLREAGVPRSAPALRAIGYLDVWDHLEGVISLERAFERIVNATRRYAKRQRTWIRSEPNVTWMRGVDQAALYAEATERIAC